MNKIILKEIDSLPPLPNTVLELEKFRNSADKSMPKLVSIIEKDPLIVATLLKIANSAMFSFSKQIDSTQRAVNLLGMNFTISLALGSAIKNSFNDGLSAYGLSGDDFMNLASISSTLLSAWLIKTDQEFKDELSLPMFLLETGRFILSKIAVKNSKESEFLQKIKAEPSKILEIEKEYFGMNSIQVSAFIFKHWQLSDNLVEIIKDIGEIKNSSGIYKKKIEILDVIDTICSVIEPLGEESCRLGVLKAKQYALDFEVLREAIYTTKEKILPIR